MLFSLLFALLAKVTIALNVKPSDDNSVENALSLISTGLYEPYLQHGPGSIPGMLIDGYYWWEAGGVMGGLLDYQYLLQNKTYDSYMVKGLSHQAGSDGSYMPSNQSLTEGNDDQGFWGIAAIGAAERNFTNPPSGDHGWLYSAQAVFNTMKNRWDTSECGGGLRWQIYTWNSGYDYKNVVSNGVFLNIASRLARYTGNSTYSDWADKIWVWLADSGFVQENGDSYLVYDGSGTENNCSNPSTEEWSYNYGLLISATSYMYDHTNGSSKWEDRATKLWSRAKSIFFENQVMYEYQCEKSGKCNTDQQSFKAYFSRFLGHAAIFVPSISDEVMSYLNTSATAAGNSCSGGSDGHTCGTSWLTGGWDNTFGAGQQLCALEVIQNTRVLGFPKPFTQEHGGSSNGSTDAGSGVSLNPLKDNSKITTKDRAGAGVVTALLMIGLIGVGVWMLL